MMQLAPGGNVDHLLREEKGFDGGSEDPRLFTEFWALLYYKQVSSRHCAGRRSSTQYAVLFLFSVVSFELPCKLL